MKGDEMAVGTHAAAAAPNSTYLKPDEEESLPKRVLVRKWETDCGTIQLVP